MLGLASLEECFSGRGAIERRLGIGLSIVVDVDRYHHVVLKSPTQVRNALRYVLLNARRHMKRKTRQVLIDPASSGRWFDGWKRGSSKLIAAARGRPGALAIATPHTWLLAEGWRKAGPRLDPAETPG